MCDNPPCSPPKRGLSEAERCEDKEAPVKHLNFSPSIGRHKARILVKAAFAGKETGLGKETLQDRGLYALEFILHPFMIILWPISGVEEPVGKERIEMADMVMEDSEP